VEISQYLIRIFSAACLSAAFNAHAFQVSSLSPQGEVAQVRQLVVKFDEAAVNFGDPKAAARFAARSAL
jgi:alpha-2-macroglobulin